MRFSGDSVLSGQDCGWRPRFWPKYPASFTDHCASWRSRFHIDFDVRTMRTESPDSFGPAAIGLIAFLAVLGYACNDFLPTTKAEQWAQRLPDGPSKAPLLWLAGHVPLVNEIAYPLWYQFQHNREGHGSTCYALGFVQSPILAIFHSS